MPPTTTGIALCGAGRITMVHALAAAALPDLRFTRVASRDPAHAAERAGQLGAIAGGYADLPGDADLVIVATPPARHAADALQAMAGGAATLVEKPLCTTLDDADRLVAAADAGGRLTYGENLVHAPPVRAAVDRARRLGPLTFVECRALQGRPDWGDFTSPDWGGGVLFDLGVHPLAVALLLAGDDPLLAVRAELEQPADLEVDAHADVWLRFGSGLTAHVEASWEAEAMVWDLQASSASGVVRADLAPVVDLEHDGEPVPLPPTRPGVEVPQVDAFGFVDQLAEAVAVAGGAPVRCGAAFGRVVLDVVCAAYASAGAGGTEVPLPFSGRRDRTPLELWRGR